MARILMVEDDDSVRQLAARAMARMGHQVDVACDGAEGLDRIIEADGGYDLVVSDIRMPLVDGIEMAKKAAAGYPGLKILLVTGFADQRERAADLDGVVVDVLLKPFTLDAIRAAVSTHLAAAAA
jgi:DNA-binding NtrC family response regulator